MWVTKLLIPVKIRIFCPKTTKFSPKLAFLSIAGPFGGLAGGCGAGCISQDTYLLYGYLCKTRYEYDIDGAHRNTFLVVEDTEALPPAPFRSARFNALGLVQKMRRDGKLFVEEEGLEV